MNLRHTIAVAVAAVMVMAAYAAEDPENAGANNIIIIKTSKVSRPLVTAWAEAYMQSHPDINIQLTTKMTANADLTATTVQADAAEHGVSVGRYALLPITRTDNPLYPELQKKNWTASDLKKFYFDDQEAELDEEDDQTTGKAGKLRQKLIVYSGATSSSASEVFARHFGFTAKEIRGNKIAGDDLYLISAIDEDRQSITFNNVAYLYDTESRRLKEHLAILPLNVKHEVEEALQGGNLDATLQALEEQPQSLIPVEDLRISYTRLTAQQQAFLSWVVENGQIYNQRFGFLRIK